jgi:hypothetical protein
LLHLVTVLSLLLCVAVVMLWVASYLPEQFHFRSHKGQFLLVFAAKQYANFFSGDPSLPLDGTIEFIKSYTAGEPSAAHFEFAGFEVALTDRDSGFWFFAVPHWAVALPLAAVAGWGWWTSRRRRRREKAGRCLQCGYDLRASPGRCPECGRPATAAAVERECGTP